MILLLRYNINNMKVDRSGHSNCMAHKHLVLKLGGVLYKSFDNNILVRKIF